MAARSIGSLTVSFGLVAIPVKLYTATESARSISFNLLHKGCGSRLKQVYFCAKEDVPVSRDEMVKGYEFAKDQYVQFSSDELKAMEEAGTQVADITEFVPISAVDPVFYDKPYYLAPDKGGAKPYALLAKALRDAKRCAIGTWAARGKQHIVMIRPVDEGLVMQQLLYASEVRPIADVEIPHIDVSDAELKLAKQLIDQSSAPRFDASQYTDEVSARIEAAVQKQVEGQEITLAETAPPTAQVIDLMEALRASLEKKGAKPAAAAPRAAPRAAAPDKQRKPPKRAEPAPAAKPAASRARKR